MSLAASPPPVSLFADGVDYDRVQDDLDDDISKIRAESKVALISLWQVAEERLVQELTQRRRLISATLLGSTKIQKQLHTASASNNIDPSTAPVITESQLDNLENIHRLAFSVTSFPYTDPSPETSHIPLLGIRIDICSRTGKFDAPYYIHLKRKPLNDTTNELDELSVYRHTIPSHIPLRNYEAQYLPPRDEGYGSEVSSESANASKQDLHMFIRKVRRDIVSWTLRREAIEVLAEKLGLVPESTTDVGAAKSDEYASFVAPVDAADGSVFKSIAATAVEARFVRVVWANGRLARVKISDKGLVERAVVFGEVSGEDRRIKVAEKVLVGDGFVRIEELSELLKVC
jgi:central kinetochore subunit Mal2/MCM21